MNIHRKYMHRCIQLGQNGLATAAPNPSVGAVVVCNDKIIGEGFTSAYGGAHAEVNAISAVTEPKLLSQSTLYVTLEPCAHFGKTPPCTELIIESKIPKVVIGCKDSFDKVQGRGVAKLKEAGVKVVEGFLEKECRFLHRRFFTFHEMRRPYIILKWAESEDGYIAPLQKAEASPVWLSNEFSRQLVHKWRGEELAILVGAKTVMDDNPSLTTRDYYGRNPIKVVLGSAIEFSDKLNIYNKDEKVILFGIRDPKIENVIFYSLNSKKSTNIASQICEGLYGEGISSMIVEGGARTLQTFIDENLWDEARIFRAPQKLIEGISAPEIVSAANCKTTIVTDQLSVIFNDQNHHL